MNSIGDNGAVALSEALKTNLTLTSLELRNNKIGDNGAVALSEALKINPTLTTLDLHSNSIGPNGVQALSEPRNTNTTVTLPPWSERLATTTILHFVLALNLLTLIYILLRY